MMSDEARSRSAKFQGPRMCFLRRSSSSNGSNGLDSRVSASIDAMVTSKSKAVKPHGFTMRILLRISWDRIDPGLKSPMISISGSTLIDPSIQPALRVSV